MVGTRSKATAGPSKMMPEVRKINVVRPKQGNLVKSCTQRKTRRNMEMGKKNVEEEENVEPVLTRKMMDPRRIRELGKKEDVKVEANVEPESTRKSIAPRRMREMGKKEDVKVEANVEPESTRKTIAPRKMREIGKKNVEEEENVEPVSTRKTIAPRRIRGMGKKKDVKEEENVEPELTRKTIAPRRMRVTFHSSPLKSVHHMKKKNFKMEMEKKDDVKEEENVEPKPMRKTIAPQRMTGCVSSHGQDLPMPINVVSGNLHQPSHEATTTKRIEDAHTSSPSVPFHISPSKAGTCEDVEPSRKTCTVPLESLPCPCPSPPPISLKVKRSYSRLSEPSVMGHSPLPSCSGESQTPTRNSSSVQHDSLFGFANMLSSEQLASISPVHSREQCSFPAAGSFVLPCSQGTEDCFPIPGVELDKKKKKKRIARQLDVLEIHDMVTKLNKEFCDAEEFQLIVE